MPVPIGVADESSAPVALAMVPPEQPLVLALVQVPPVPVMVKLPEVLDSMIPLGPPLAETLVNETASGVVLLARVISTAVAPDVLTLPLAVVIVLVLSVASRPRLFASGVRVSAPNVIAPLFVRRLIPVSADPVTEVAAKPSVALELLTLMPIPVGFVIVVEPVVKLPATFHKLMPVAEAEEDAEDEGAAVDAASDRVARLSSQWRRGRWTCRYTCADWGPWLRQLPSPSEAGWTASLFARRSGRVSFPTFFREI